MRRKLFALFAALAQVPPVEAAMPMPAERLDWQCEQRYDTLFHVECSLGGPTAVLASNVAVEQVDVPLPTAPNRYIPVGQRPTAEIHAFPAWRIPLYNVPIDRSGVEHLLQSVLCGTAPGCTVRYDAGRPEALRRTAHPFIR